MLINFRKRHPVNRAQHGSLRDLEPAGTRTVSGSCNAQVALFTAERQGELRSVVTF
jgi:hypothetical protein